MLETSTRLLRLLSLLQVQLDWSGAALADRLGVSTRTVRTDVNRLRHIGYPIDAVAGVGGGYRLRSGSVLPPLVLDDDEAVAVVVGLRTAATGGVAGIEESSVRALAKLEQILPSHLRHRVAALHDATVAVPAGSVRVDAGIITTIAAAVRASERVHFDYTDHGGSGSVRVVEPHRLVFLAGRWYLLGWDVHRDRWRTFRVDRMHPHRTPGARFTPRVLAEADAAALVQRGADTAAWQYRARVVVHLTADEARQRLPRSIEVTPSGDDRCEIEVGSDTADQLAGWIGLLGADVEIGDAPELAEAFRRLAARYRRAAASGVTPRGSEDRGRRTRHRR